MNDRRASRWQKSTLAKCVGSVVLVLAAFTFRLLFERWLEGRAAYLPFVVAVVAVAIRFGRGPAIRLRFVPLTDVNTPPTRIFPSG